MHSSKSTGGSFFLGRQCSNSNGSLGKPKPRGKAGVLATAALLFLITTSASFAGYTIQVANYDTRVGAEAAALKLRLKGYSPVGVKRVDGSAVGARALSGQFRVCVGVFATYADAWSANSRLLRDNDISSAGREVIETQADDASGLTVGAALRLKLDEPFNYLGADRPEPADAQEWLAATGRVLKVDGKSTTASVADCETMLKQNSAGTARGRYARLRLIRAGMNSTSPEKKQRAAELLNEVKAAGGSARDIVSTNYLGAYVSLHSGDTNNALDSFRTVAGDMSAPSSLRRDAMRRAAAIYHTQKRYPEAWAAFDSLALSAASSPIERTEARMQQAGLAFELRKDGKGTWDEVRGLCVAAASEPGTAPEIAATADLMNSETYIEERRWSEALALSDKFLATYTGTAGARERHLARLWRALALYKLGRLDEAKQQWIDAAAIAKDAPKTELFKGPHPRALALAWLAALARQQNDASDEAAWVTEMNAEFPGTGADNLQVYLASDGRK